MSHPDPMQDYGDEDIRYWQEVGQFQPERERTEIRRLTRMMYEGQPEEAARQATAQGLYAQFSGRLSRVHRRLIYQYRGEPSMPKEKLCP